MREAAWGRFRLFFHRRAASAVLVFLLFFLIASCQGSGERADRTDDTPAAPGRAVKIAAVGDRRAALVMGNGAYDDSPLKNPANDARDMAASLRGMGFEVIEVVDADKRKMVESVEAFGRKLRAADVGLFFFAGHGMQIKGRNYLIPVGARVSVEADAEFEAVDAGRILGQMEAAGNRVNIVILDACRDNPLGRGFRSSESGLARMDAPTGSYIAFSTGPGSVAADGEAENGLFSGSFLRHMRTPGLKIEDVMKRVRNDVLSASRNKQTPWESSSLTGDFYFIPGQGTVAAAPPVAPGPSSVPTSPRPTTPVAPPQPPSSSGVVDYSEVIKKRAESQRQWALWQTKMETEFKKVQGYEKMPSLSDAEKEAAWSSFLTAYETDNEFGDRDEELRRQAREREDYWKQKSFESERKKLEADRLRAEEEQRRKALEEERLRKLEEEKQRLASSPTGKTFTNSIGQKFVLIPAGTFLMGSPESPAELARKYKVDEKYVNDERQHRVTISKAFYMQTTEVTQGQWRAVMGNIPSYFSSCGDDCPVEQVSWEDAEEFIRRLNAKEGVGAYRLPTEAEWECAARAGTETAIYTGPLTVLGENNGPELDPIAWYGGNSGVSYAGGYDCSGWPEKQYSSGSCGPHPVGRKRPNAWGLYDMIGNVWEWCQDWHGEYSTGSEADPPGPASGSGRVDRGGGWSDLAGVCRSAHRGRSLPGLRYSNLGLRLARTY
ncbi:MAG: SUMF1/EgtB/PvdO family nonheme iron enzyme [Pseudomonadota bacterium]